MTLDTAAMLVSIANLSSLFDPFLPNFKSTMSTVTANGLDFWVHEDRPQGVEKGVVLLLHGFPDTSDM